MQIRRLAIMAVAALSAVVAAAPADAEESYKNLCPSLSVALCEPPGTPNSFELYTSLAVDDSTGASAGDVWVANSEAGSLSKFDAAGNKLLEVGAETRAYLFSQSLAVDPVTDGVYMVREVEETQKGLGNENLVEILKFNSSGVLQSHFRPPGGSQGVFEGGSLAVQTNGDVYVSDSFNQVIDKFDSSGMLLEQTKMELAPDAKIALDPQGHLYVLNPEPLNTFEPRPENVRVYTSTGAPDNCPNGSNVLYEETIEEQRARKELNRSAAPGSLAVDQSDGHIFVGVADLANHYDILEYTGLCTTPHIKFGPNEFGGRGSSAIGVNATTHEVYAESAGTKQGVWIYGPVTIPDVTTSGPAANVTRTSAEASGVVNPDEIPVTTCEFEYGTSPAYGQSVPCSRALPLEGGNPVPVSANLSFSLPPSSLVHYRLKAGNENGVNYGEDHTFYSEALRSPIVGGLPATAVSQFAATLHGTIVTFEGFVNYRFEYGTSIAYGQLAPIPDAVTPVTTETVSLSQPIQGLQAGTTYHYRLVASSPGGTEVKSPDESFTTGGIPAPSAVTGGASGVSVASATVAGTVDPHDWDTSYTFQYGTSTAYGSSWPTVLVDLGALEGPQPVVVNIPGLLPNTTYHYRLIASNAGGTTYGADMTFTTSEYASQTIVEPPAIGTLLVPSEVGKVGAPGAKNKKKKNKGKQGRKHKRVKKRKARRARAAHGARRGR